MKKISLKDLVRSEIEPLSREQLKNVMGGMISAVTTTTARPAATTATGGDDCSYRCNCQNGTSVNIDCKGMTTAQIIALCVRMCGVPD
ncbi:hypothetical protein [Pedobacter suwonensis]|uniref:hypothetical protein n=1 Tax=Pedobacter suwonensis TaxID=332999 RepID=UPI0011A920AA|nr:hypothetical protein [Pedobacter suwonensis]